MTVPAHLQALAKRYPNIPSALAELANLHAILTLQKPTVHVVSDVHGEYVKLRQVINNASGSLRPLVERLFADKLDAAQQNELLAFFYYPRETWLLHTRDRSEADRRAKLLWFVPRAVAVLRELARHYTLRHVDKIIPDPFDAIFHELLFSRDLTRQPEFLEGLLDPFLRHDLDVDLVRMISRTVRNLAVGELVVAGDLGDRGPRIDKVIDLLMQQPKVSITWGNHDTVWMAACLGHPAAIMTVIRVSLRYRRLSQLEEGYGIPMAPLERLAREVYGDDPAARFQCKGEGLRDSQLMARMQKAAAILQFKLEGQLFQQRADWNMQHRALLHRIDPVAGTVDLDGTRHPLLDTRLPTVDWADPYRLSADEAKCLTRLTRSFLESGSMWKQMTFVASRGRMALRRDQCAIFHGCMPVDETGAFLSFAIDGEPHQGKALFDAIDRVVQRAFRKHASADVDLLFYLWTGPLSPCFGKDRMSTFETYFVADKAAQKETKNPYFKLIHDAAFCARVLRELGVDEREGYLINGHVPVKLEQGETPVKKSGRAITIDGAFAAAYGDKGFSLVLDAHRMYLAQHHHFESADAAVETGADIVPTVSEVRVYDRPRTVGDTEAGDGVRSEIAVIEELVAAFETNLIRPSASR
ncbi:MAG: Fructose,6-bisphosphatase [Deltaproteobacteria bacterium]|nr:Fructose,6-bisphosphatase [Deltaproteobacteria bacterium]